MKISLKTHLERTAPGRLFISLYRRIRERKLQSSNYYAEENLIRLSTDELRSLLRHDCHRIEKAFYNGIFEAKKAYYTHKLTGIRSILSLLAHRGQLDAISDETVWINKIVSGFESLQTSFIDKESTLAPPTRLEKSVQVLTTLRERRSCRVWSTSQPDESTLRSIAIDMIDAARWAPNSGNRQPWRFAIITEQSDKDTLKGLKEEHCYNAPLLIFIGMDRRFYAAAGHLDNCLHIDAGAAISNMITLATFCGIGTCWNHFSQDLISSRPSNEQSYHNFSKRIGIPSHIEPVAILAVGISSFLPPPPARTPIGALLLNHQRQ